MSLHRAVTERNDALILVHKLLDLAIFYLIRADYNAVELYSIISLPINRVLGDLGIPVFELVPQNRLKIIGPLS